MTITDAVLLGIIQGASEFLPISSSAHLVFGQVILGVNEPGIFLEIALHLGTLLSVLIYYRKDIARMLQALVKYFDPAQREQYRTEFFMCLFIIVATIPAAVGGLLLKDWFEARYDSASVSGYELMITGVILLLTRFAPVRDKALGFLNSFIIGIAQFTAILPGISRSGTTMAAGLFLGISPNAAARFSFLLSLPSVAGACLLKALDLRKAGLVEGELLHFGIGAVVSFVVGIATIHYLLKLMSNRKFYLFGFYCLVVGLLTFIYL